MKKFWKVFPLILIAAGIICLLVYFSAKFTGNPQAEVSPAVSPAEAPSVSQAPESSSQEESSSEASSEAAADPTASYPEGKLFITGERAHYESGDMTLTVPRLKLDHIPVLGDVTDETLKKGIGLYDYAQLPGKGNRNVSIAGHRDLYGFEFYDIDKLTDGDELYLTWKGQKYTYKYKDTKVIEPSDWSPIYIQGFSCLTLTSCHPIGIADHRMIVRAELTEIEPDGFVGSSNEDTGNSQNSQ